MLSRLSVLAFGLAVGANAQSSNSIVEVGDTLVSAMMVRLSIFQSLFNYLTPCSDVPR